MTRRGRGTTGAAQRRVGPVTQRLSACIAAVALALTALLAGGGAGAAPATCRVGVYLTGLSPINFGDQTVQIDFYTWTRCPESVTAENARLAMVGANSEERSEVFEEARGGERYRYERVRATVRVPLSLRRYPFDTQRIPISMESSNATADDVRLTLDDDAVLWGSQCCMDDSVQIRDWVVRSAVARTDVRRFRTRFGYHSATQDLTSYPRVQVVVEIQREVLPYIWKVLLPLAIIIAMALQCAFWPLGDFDASTNVLIASLLSVVASHLTQRSELPNTGYLVHGDLFFMHAYLMLLLMLVTAGVIRRCAVSGREELAHKLQRIQRWAIPISTLVGWGLIGKTG